MTCALEVGDRVNTVHGFKWPGVVIGVCRNMMGNTLYVVECVSPDVAGAVKIFRSGELKKVERRQGPLTRADIMAARTPKGGWSRQTIESFGLRYPPRQGWIERLLASQLDAEETLVR